MIYEVVQSLNTTPEEWRVEGIDHDTGDVYVTLFSGPRAQQRAEAYAALLSPVEGRQQDWTPSVKPDPAPSPQHAPRGGRKMSS